MCTLFRFSKALLIDRKEQGSVGYMLHHVFLNSPELVCQIFLGNVMSQASGHIFQNNISAYQRFDVLAFCSC